MQFNSFGFFILFLPAVLLAWHGCMRLGRKEAAKAVLAAASVCFIAGFGLQTLLVFALQSGIAYGLSWMLSARKRGGKRPADGSLFCGVALLLLLGVLGLFKCGGYLPRPGFWSVMPLGISFYTFSLVTFVLDRRDFSLSGGASGIPHPAVADFCLYASFFPKFAEGPISRCGEFQESVRRALAWGTDTERLLRGLCLFVMGMGKKLLLSDPLAGAVDFGFSSAYLTDTATGILTVTAYVFQLYFDFSGYMDMGCGIAWMFGIDLPRNFDTPFRATDFSSFWKRWHMTLTGFLTRCVYIPLGGSRHGEIRTFLNVVLVFMISGLWHGTGMTYLVWGLLCGLLVWAARFLRRGKDGAGRGKTALLRLLNFCIFGFTLIFFRSESVAKAAAFVRRLFYGTWPGFVYRLAANYTPVELYPLRKALSLVRPGMSGAFQLGALLLHLCVCGVLVSGERDARGIAQSMRLDAGTGILTGILLIWCMASFSGVSTYLYFQY